MSDATLDILKLYRQELKLISQKFSLAPPEKSVVRTAISNGLHEITWSGAEMKPGHVTLSMNFFALLARGHTSPLTLISYDNPILDHSFWIENSVLPGRLISVGCLPRQVPEITEKICLEATKGLIGVISRSFFPYSILRSIKNSLQKKSATVVLIRPSAQSLPTHQELFDSRWSVKNGIASNEEYNDQFLSLQLNQSQDIRLVMPS